MNLLLATNGMKGCLSPNEIASILAQCIERDRPDIHVTSIPGIDGGEGFSRDLTEHLGGEVHNELVVGPLGEDIDACFGIVECDGKKFGLIESAAAIGLSKIPVERRNPMYTSTYGVGQLILKCLDHEPDVIMVGCGDSSTNDAGVGMAQALGVRFLDENGNEVALGGMNLESIASIDRSSIDPRIASTDFVCICNLKSIMCGDKGTTRIHATRKGASVAEMFALERGVSHYVELVKQSLGVDIAFMPGGGGSGGIGSALSVYCDAELNGNFRIMQDLGIEDAIARADEVVIAEGMIDFTTFRGKVNQQIISLARNHGTRVVAVVGKVDGEKIRFLERGIDTILDINEGCPEVADVMLVARERITNAFSAYLTSYPA